MALTVNSSGTMIYGYEQLLPSGAGTPSNISYGYTQYLPQNVATTAWAIGQYLPAPPVEAVIGYTQFLIQQSGIDISYNQYLPQQSNTEFAYVANDDSYRVYLETIATASGTAFSPAAIQANSNVEISTTAAATGVTFTPLVAGAVNNTDITIIIADASTATGITFELDVETTAGSGATQRHIPMNWIPRWMEPHYDLQSYMRKWYFLSCYYPRHDMQRVLYDNIVPQFHGEVIADRLGYIAKYHYPKTYIPHVICHVGRIATTVTHKDTMGSFLFEKTVPVYTRDNDKLLFKNLAVRSVILSSSSGVIDLSTTFLEEAIADDSIIVVKNYYGDLLYFDQSDQRYDPDTKTLYVSYDGSYTIYYLSELRVDNFRTGKHYITVDGERVDIKPHYFRNTWDEYAWLKSLKRKDTESNLKLKGRCQHVSLSKTAEQKISSSLGQTYAFMWDTASAINVTSVSTGITGARLSIVGERLLDLPKYLYIQEFPYKVGTNYLLSHKPSGYIQVFLDTVKVESDNYTVSGSYIIPNSNSLKNAPVGSVRVHYKHTNITFDGVSLTAYDDYSDPAIGILTKNVRISNAVKKKLEWRWNQELGQLSGLADFDF